MTVAALLALALASGCADGTGESGWLDRAFGSPGAEDDKVADAAAGDGYPNLASVPARPAGRVAADRAASIAALEQERAQGEARRAALAAGVVVPGQSAAGQVRLGAVAPDPSGRFSAADEALLRRAVSQPGTARIRLAGPAAAALATADRLVRLGFDRSRIDLLPSPAAMALSPQVEILVASGGAGR